MTQVAPHGHENGAMLAAMPRPFFGASTPIPFAHRGGALRRPENTLLAFEYAADLGYRHIETDIHETSDGRFVLFHDPTLERTTNGGGNLADHTLAELKRLDAGHNFIEEGSYPFRDADVRIPTLEEALELDPNIHYNLEIKPEEPSIGKRLWELIDHHGIHDLESLYPKLENKLSCNPVSCPWIHYGSKCSFLFHHIHDSTVQGMVPRLSLKQ